jgi:hypothetical protein
VKVRHVDHCTPRRAATASATGTTSQKSTTRASSSAKAPEVDWLPSAGLEREGRLAAAAAGADDHRAHGRLHHEDTMELHKMYLDRSRKCATRGEGDAPGDRRAWGARRGWISSRLARRGEARSRASPPPAWSTTSRARGVRRAQSRRRAPPRARRGRGRRGPRVHHGVAVLPPAQRGAARARARPRAALLPLPAALPRRLRAPPLRRRRPCGAASTPTSTPSTRAGRGHLVGRVVVHAEACPWPPTSSGLGEADALRGEPARRGVHPALSAFSGEEEYVIAPGTRFRVRSAAVGKDRLCTVVLDELDAPRLVA